MSWFSPLRLLVAACGVLPSGAWAQLGELQVGVVGGYGLREPYRVGGGVLMGVAPGRLAYVGLRLTFHEGSTTPGDVRTRTRVFAADLGIQVPVGPVEIVPGVSLGVVRFAQRAQSPTGTVSRTSKEFVAAPGVAVQLTASRLALIPEIQYYLTGSPELAWPVRHRGFVASVRLVFLAEIRRIRR